jgi:trigger factor
VWVRIPPWPSKINPREAPLKIEYKALEGCKRQLDIEIPGEIVNKEITRASVEMARFARVPGFRPGKVPRSVIRQRYKAELRQEALRNLLPSAVETAVEQHKLRIVGEPAVEKLDFENDGKLVFTVGIEVLPDFEVKEWSGLPVVKRVYKVTDDDVAKVVDKLREDAADLVADDAEGREVRDGDFVSLDLEGTIVESEGEHHGHAHEPLKIDDVTIEVGANGVLDEFNSNLRGMKVAEEREFRVAYPAEFPNPGLAGHTVDYKARLVAIRTKDVPEFDDEFAKEHSDGQYDSAEAWRESVREDLGLRAEQRSTQELHEAVIDGLLSGNEFPVPDVFVEQQAKQRVDNLARSFSSRGMDPRHLSLDWAGVFDNAKKAAERDVRAAFIIDRIAQSEGVTVTDEEVDAEIAETAEALDQPEAQVRARLTKDGGADSIRDRIRHRKVLDLVAKAARATVEEIEGVDARTDESEGENPQADGADAADGTE